MSQDPPAQQVGEYQVVVDKHVEIPRLPRYSRNLNTGGPTTDEIRMEIAKNRIYLDAAHPSHIMLPVYAWVGG
jgi:hypothetical protein